MIANIPNTILSFPGPWMTRSVARYWSPKACLPMHIGLVQPEKWYTNIREGGESLGCNSK